MFIYVCVFWYQIDNSCIPNRYQVASSVASYFVPSSYPLRMNIYNCVLTLYTPLYPLSTNLVPTWYNPVPTSHQLRTNVYTVGTNRGTCMVSTAYIDILLRCAQLVVATEDLLNSGLCINKPLHVLPHTITSCDMKVPFWGRLYIPEDYKM